MFFSFLNVFVNNCKCIIWWNVVIMGYVIFFGFINNDVVLWYGVVGILFIFILFFIIIWVFYDVIIVDYRGFVLLVFVVKLEFFNVFL